MYFESLVSEPDASTAGRYLLGRIGRGKREKRRTGTWLVVNAKRRRKKSCEQLPYAVTKKSPFHSGRLLVLTDSPPSPSYLVLPLAVRPVLNDVPPVVSTFDAT